jgi:hypothetical protein
MARQVFFSFDYADIMNANIVRNSGQFKQTKETGFYDASLWEEPLAYSGATIRSALRGAKVKFKGGGAGALAE